MAEMIQPLRSSRMEAFLHPASEAPDTWLRAHAPINHRFDKLGNPLPMELHGCGCGLCARQRRAQLKYWEAR
jgi:uncharacterized protein (UPF0276 family)